MMLPMRKLSFLLIAILVSLQAGGARPAFAATNDATIEVLGGGGGGGVAGTTNAGGGGGGGEYRRCTETLSVQSYTVTVGVGGTIDTVADTDSSFSGTGISMTADGGDGTTGSTAGVAGTGGTSTNCDSADANFDGGTPGAGNTTGDVGGGGGGGAGYGGKGGNGANGVSNATGGGGGGGAGESGAGGNTTTVSAGAAGSGGGGAGGVGVTTTYGASSDGAAGTPATYHIVGGGGGGGGDDGTRGGACGAPGAGSGGADATGAGNGCRGEVRIIYVDSEINATGGTETTSGIFRIHTFTTSGTFQVTSITVVESPPTVQTDAESGVSSFAATLNGQITATGNVNSTVRGFAWGTSSTLSGGDTSTTTDDTGSFGTGAFSQWVTNLKAGTRYYYRAYATNSAGTGYGAIDFLDTSAASTLKNRKARLFSGYRISLFKDGVFRLRQQ